MKVIHHRPEKFEGQLDFGTLGVNESRSMIFTIRNDNPYDIVVAAMQTNMSWASVALLGMEKGNGTTLTRKHNLSEINSDSFNIKPYHYAVFNVSIVAPGQEGAYVADIWMFTQYQDLFIPIIFRAAEGSLHAIPDKFVFDKVYPGRVPYKVLQIHSTFDDYMEVRQVTFQPGDSRFYFIPQNSNTVLLQPHEHSIVGKIYFDAKKECKDDCYVGLPTVSPAGHQWLLGLSLDRDVADTDQYLYTKLQQKWDKLENQQQNIANVTIELDTNQVRGFLFSAQAYFQWPSIVKKSKIKYPLTQIGNLSISDFIVENPGDEPVLVQLLPLSLYPNAHTILDLMSHRLAQDLTDYVESDESNTFILYDLEHTGSSQKNNGGGSSSSSSSGVAQHRRTVESILGVVPHKQTLAALLQPGGKLKVKVGFQPKDDLLKTSLIVIRNNLTIIDAVVVQGEGRRGDMRFNNKKPGSHSALTFEMTEKHLKNCDPSEKKLNKNILPNFTWRRPFTLRNSGDLPFYVHGFSINDLPCEGYGFKVLDCFGFEMPPNSSRKVNIAFTPDFTMSQIQRMLTIHTSLGPPASEANYSLQAMVPYDLLSQCSAALPRPSWEPLLYYFVVCLMGFIICCIVGLSYFESDRVMADYIRKRLKVTNSTQTFDKGKVFDLRNVGVVSSTSHNPTVTTNVTSAKHSISSSTNHYNSNRPLLNGHLTNTEGDRGTLPNMLGVNNTSLLNSASTLGSKAANTNNKTSRRTFIGSLVRIVRSLSMFKYINFSKKASPVQQEKPVTKDSGTSPPSPIQKPTATVSALRQEPVVTTSSPATTAHEPTVYPEKSIPNTTSYSSRGRKGRLNSRRQIVPDTSGDNNTESNYKKQKDNKESSSDCAPNRRNTTAMIDDFDDLPLGKFNPNLDSLDDLDDIDIKLDLSTSRQGKYRSNNKRTKSKTKSDQSKDRLQLRRDSSLMDDCDEVSSTTTESSGGDVDEKNSLNQDNTSDVTTAAINNSSGGRKWKKGGNKHMERLVVATHGGEPVDDDSNFEVTSKSKAHRKIQVNKETFGGDIMIPSTIELPYCLPKEREKAESEAKRSKRVKKNQKTKGRTTPPLFPSNSTDGAEGSSDTGRESPPPVWDQPEQSDEYLPIPGDLSELSLQTESFAQKHARPATNTTTPAIGTTAGLSSFGFGSNPSTSIGHGFPPERPSTSSRASSYSSIVSSNSGGLGSGVVVGSGGHGTDSLGRPSAAVGARIGGVPAGASSPLASGQFASPGFGPFSDKNMPNMISSGLPKTSHGSAWSPTIGDPNSAYSLPPIGESTVAGSFGLPSARGLDNFVYGNTDSNPLFPLYPDSVNQPQLTMMQQLQVERRRRFWEHQQKINKGEDWPGFNQPLVCQDSLWDNDYNPMEHTTWSPNADSNPSNMGFWSTLTNSASNGWSSLQSLANIWGSTPQTDPGSGTSSHGEHTGFSTASSSELVDGQQLSTNTPSTFNPFTSMADIWSPSSAPPTHPGSSGINTSIGGNTSPGSAIGQWSPLSGSTSSPPPSPASPKEE